MTHDVSFRSIKCWHTKAITTAIIDGSKNEISPSFKGARLGNRPKSLSIRAPVFARNDDLELARAKNPATFLIDFRPHELAKEILVRKIEGDLMILF